MRAVCNKTTENERSSLSSILCLLVIIARKTYLDNLKYAALIMKVLYVDNCYIESPGIEHKPCVIRHGTRSVRAGIVSAGCATSSPEISAG